MSLKLGVLDKNMQLSFMAAGKKFRLLKKLEEQPQWQRTFLEPNWMPQKNQMSASGKWTCGLSLGPFSIQQDDSRQSGFQRRSVGVIPLGPYGHQTVAFASILTNCNDGAMLLHVFGEDLIPFNSTLFSIKLRLGKIKCPTSNSGQWPHPPKKIIGTYHFCWGLICIHRKRLLSVLNA